MSLERWECRRPDCQAHNLVADRYCAVCHAPRETRGPVVTRRIEPVDLEPFAREHFIGNRRRLHAAIDMVGGELFLTLTPPTGDPAIFAIDQNALKPCDNFGRPAW